MEKLRKASVSSIESKLSKISNVSGLSNNSKLRKKVKTKSKIESSIDRLRKYAENVLKKNPEKNVLKIDSAIS